jgi:hypothetical protein
MQAKATPALTLVTAPDCRHAAANLPGGHGEILQRLSARSAAMPDRRAKAGLGCEVDVGVVAEEHG